MRRLQQGNYDLMRKFMKPKNISTEETKDQNYGLGRFKIIWRANLYFICYFNILGSYEGPIVYC